MGIKPVRAKKEYMFDQLRLFKAADWQGGKIDGTMNTLHAVLYTPFSSTIGNSFLAMVGAYAIVVMLFATENAVSYIGAMS